MLALEEREQVCEIIGVLDIKACLRDVSHQHWQSRENVVDGPSCVILF